MTQSNKSGSKKNRFELEIAETKDNLAKDLIEIITDSHDINANLNTEILMMKLCSYIVRRDHNVFNHAYKLGQKNV